MRIPVIAIFDVGKTNKKFLLFDESYKVRFESGVQLEETEDEDGYPCEDVNALTFWVRSSMDSLLKDERWEVRAVNFSGYGASFVYIDEGGKVLSPLYNYLKPYPEKWLRQFYTRHGSREELHRETASPLQDSLTSGLQLYRMKFEKPELFKRIRYALHLPQYLSYILTGLPASDITSIGSHTGLWDFGKNHYHDWVREEHIDAKLAGILPSDTCFPVRYDGKDMRVGIGLHDSSSALIPYLSTFREPFLLLSTGTWCVSLNPFNKAPLTQAELEKDCLFYLSYRGEPVKAARLFTGYEHDRVTRQLTLRFDKPPDYFESVRYDAQWLEHPSPPKTFEQAYHQLISDMVARQGESTGLVLKDSPASRILVDGGFSKNPIFMALLAKRFPGRQVYAASVAQASAIGAALCVHEEWNGRPRPEDIIELKS